MKLKKNQTKHIKTFMKDTLKILKLSKKKNRGVLNE